MYLISDIPPPYLFNALKHHQKSVCAFISRAKSNAFPEEVVVRRMARIGRSMIDFYLGDLTPLDICIEVESCLRSIDCYDEKSYKAHIEASPKKYRLMDLSDGSRLTLLVGRNVGRYVHIHPARGSEFTIRVRAIALKTAILLRLHYDDRWLRLNLVDAANEVRQHYLKESPIKNEWYTKGLKRLLKYL